MSLKDAFNYCISLHRRKVTLVRLAKEGEGGDLDVEIYITPSNYFRSLSGPSNTSVEGREFVVSKEVFSGITGMSNFKRGDRIIDSDLGEMAVDQIREMFDLGGEVIGWRITTR